jgi:hypothetical protein
MKTILRPVAFASALLALQTMAFANPTADTAKAPAKESDTARATAAKTDTIAVVHAKDSVNTSVVITKNSEGKVLVVKNNADTLFQETDSRFCHRHMRERLDRSRREGRGIGGGVLFGVGAIETQPLKELIDRVQSLSGRNFGLNTIDYEAFPLRGGLGYIGVGNGLRLGGGGMSGSRHYISDRFAGDSAVALEVTVGYGGLLIEKAAAVDHWNLIAGGYIGSGTIKTRVQVLNADNIVLAENNGDDAKASSTTAQFMYLEIHGAVTYSVARLFHVGAEISLPGFYSAEGFQAFTSDFFTANPTLKLRIVFGNLG